MIPIFFEKVSNVELPLDKEFIFVDNGSIDQTLIELQKLFSKNKEYVRHISFSRNFGKEAAIYVGLSEAKGDYVILMDTDLQDSPELYASIENGKYDVEKQHGLLELV